MTTLGPGQSRTVEVNVQGRFIVLADHLGGLWRFNNLPSLNQTQTWRQGRQRWLSTTLGAAAQAIGTTEALLGQAVTAIWDDALTTQPGPGPGVPVDPSIPPAPPDPAPLLPGDPPPLFPGPIGAPFMPMQTSTMSLGLIAALFALLAAVGRSAATGLVIRWASIPVWGQRLLVAAGLTAGADILFDTGPGDSGWIDLPFPLWGGLPDIPGLPIGGGGQAAGPGAIVEALTVGTWTANGVTFHRLSDGRFAVMNKHGVWTIWRPKKPVVLFTTGQANLRDILRADRILQKEAKKIAKLLRNRGFKVARHTTGHKD